MQGMAESLLGLECHCGHSFLGGGGLFSANFYSRCGPFAPCNNCLCGNYYESSDLLDSRRQTPVDDDGVNQWLVGDELRFFGRKTWRQLDYCVSM